MRRSFAKHAWFRRAHAQFGIESAIEGLRSEKIPPTSGQLMPPKGNRKMTKVSKARRELSEKSTENKTIRKESLNCTPPVTLVTCR